MPDEPIIDEQQQKEEAELRKFYEESPEALNKWFPTTNFIRFPGDKPKNAPAE